MLQITEDTPPDMLAGAMDLTVNLPNGRTVKMSVERSTPMMDLLVQITTTHHLPLSTHTLQPLSMPQTSDQAPKVLPFKPNTPIGALDTQMVKVVAKSKAIAPSLAKNAAPGAQPFESTFRLKVHLPRNQLFVTRVSRNVLLEDVMRKVCDEKNLDFNKYELKHPANLDEVLDPKLTLSDYQITEIYLILKGVNNLNQAFSSNDIMALRKEEERKQMHTKTGGGVFNLIFRRGKSSMGSGSISSDTRSISPTHSDDSRSVTPPAPAPPTTAASTAKEQPQDRPKPPQRKRRPAPKPPQVTTQSSQTSQEKSGTTSGASANNGIMVCHSRNSSDSSGYHEASVLSDHFNNASLPRRPKSVMVGEKGQGSTTNLAKMAYHSKSTTSLQVPGRKKKAAPPPPPASVRASTPSINLAVEPTPSPVVASQQAPELHATSHAPKPEPVPRRRTKELKEVADSQPRHSKKIESTKTDNSDVIREVINETVILGYDTNVILNEEVIETSRYFEPKKPASKVNNCETETTGAPIKSELIVEEPKGHDTENENSKEYGLSEENNLEGQTAELIESNKIDELKDSQAEILVEETIDENSEESNIEPSIVDIRSKVECEPEKDIFEGETKEEAKYTSYEEETKICVPNKDSTESSIIHSQTDDNIDIDTETLQKSTNKDVIEASNEKLIGEKSILIEADERASIEKLPTKDSSVTQDECVPNEKLSTEESNVTEDERAIVIDLKENKILETPVPEPKLPENQTEPKTTSTLLEIANLQKEASTSIFSSGVFKKPPEIVGVVPKARSIDESKEVVKYQRTGSVTSLQNYPGGFSLEGSTTLKKWKNIEELDGITTGEPNGIWSYGNEQEPLDSLQSSIAGSNDHPGTTFGSTDSGIAQEEPKQTIQETKTVLEPPPQQEEPKSDSADWQYQVPSPPTAFRDSSPEPVPPDTALKPDELYRKLEEIQEDKVPMNKLSLEQLEKRQSLVYNREISTSLSKMTEPDTFTTSLTKFESTYNEIRNQGYQTRPMSTNTLPNFKISTYDKPKQKIKVFEDETISSNIKSPLESNKNPKNQQENFTVVTRSESFSRQWVPSKPVSRSKSHLVLNGSKEEPRTQNKTDENISRTNSLYDVSGLQSIGVMRLIQNKLSTSTSSLNQEPPKEEPKRPPERTTYRYMGPPSINMGTWSERAKVPVTVKPDSDYKLSSKLIVNTKNDLVTSSNVVEVRNQEPINSGGSTIIKINGDKPEIDQKRFISHTTAVGYRKPFMSLTNSGSRPHSIALGSDFDISRVPIVRSVEFKKPYRDMVSITQIKEPNVEPNKFVTRVNSFQTNPVVRGFKTTNGVSKKETFEETRFGSSPSKTFHRENDWEQVAKHKNEEPKIKESFVSTEPRTETKSTLNFNSLPPQPPPPMSLSKLERTKPKVQSLGSSGDPREDLLSAIRNFGGKKGLRSVKV